MFRIEQRRRRHILSLPPSRRYRAQHAPDIIFSQAVASPRAIHESRHDGGALPAQELMADLLGKLAQDILVGRMEPVAALIP